VTPAKRWLLRAVSVVVPLAAWEIYGRAVNPILLSRPSAVLAAAGDMIADGSLPSAFAASVVVLGLGLVAAVVVGVAVGLAAGRSAVVGTLLEFPVTALYATPTVALIPLVVLWFGFEVTAKTVVVFLFAVFPVLINTSRGVREVDPELVEVARSFCATERGLWRDLVLPSALPYVVTGVRLAIGRALIGVVVAEFYTAISGLGNLIVTGANSFQTARMFVPVVLIALLGVDTETGTFMVLYLDLAWQERAAKSQISTQAGLRDAVLAGAVRRIRPKFMTVATMFLGFVPIFWSTGAGAEIMKRIAAPMIGGLATSFLMELIVYPVLYEQWKSRALPRVLSHRFQYRP